MWDKLADRLEDLLAEVRAETRIHPSGRISNGIAQAEYLVGKLRTEPAIEAAAVAKEVAAKAPRYDAHSIAMASDPRVQKWLGPWVMKHHPRDLAADPLGPADFITWQAWQSAEMAKPKPPPVLIDNAAAPYPKDRWELDAERAEREGRVAR